MREPIFTENGVKPTSPYSQALLAHGTFLYVSGQVPLDPSTGQFFLGSFREQAELTLKNLQQILEAGGCSWKDVIKVNAYLADMSNFEEFNCVYRQFVTEPFPARTTVQSNLSRVAIEVDCVAVVPDNKP